MKLTRASSYALHAMTYMASQKQNQPIASHLIAQARGIPERFLLKVLKPLVSCRVLYSIKGPNGGYRLARSASDITLLDVVEAVDGPIRGLAPLSQSAYREHARPQIGKNLRADCRPSPRSFGENPHFGSAFEGLARKIRKSKSEIRRDALQDCVSLRISIMVLVANFDFRSSCWVR